MQIWPHGIKRDSPGLASLEPLIERYSDPAEYYEVPLEAMGSIAYEKFRFEDPETDFAISLTVLPSLSNIGRFRGNLDGRLRRELISDFFVGLSLWATFDSEPPVEGTEESDYGFTTSIGYSF